MRNRAALLLALVIAAVLAAGSVVALVNSGGDSGPSVSLPTPTATASPTATETPVPTGSATPTATPTAEPTETATATSRPQATRTRTSSPSGGTHTYTYSKPTRPYDRLEMTITSDPGTGRVGDTFTLTATATDGDGTIYFNGMTWGDGTGVAAQPNPTHCKSYPPPTAPPGPYQPQPDKKNYSFTHKYLTPGDYEITVRIASVNADCRPYGPRREDQVLTVVVHVKAA